MLERPPELEKELEKAAQEFEKRQAALTPLNLLEDSSPENVSRYLDQRIENVIQEMATREATLLKLKDPTAREKMIEIFKELLASKPSPEVGENRREALKYYMQETVKTRLDALKKGVKGFSSKDFEKGIEKMIEKKIQEFRKIKKAA